MSSTPPTNAGWYWWTPPNASTPLMAYVVERPEGLTATLLRVDPGVWEEVSTMKGTWGDPCSPQEVDQEVSLLHMRWTPPPEEDFPLFI